MSQHTQLRVERLLRLINVLQSPGPWLLTDLMDELSVSRSTLFRDLKSLDAAGVPIYHERGKGYRIRRDYFLPPINLNLSEVFGLMVMAQSVSTRTGQPLTGSILSAIRKLTANAPESVRGACQELLQTVDIAAERRPTTDDASRFYPVFQQAIDEHRICEAMYKSPLQGEAVRLNIEPYLFHLVNNAWYVFGFTHEHGEVRVMKLMRFEQVKVTEQKFDPPNHFKVSDKLGNAWQLNPEGRDYEVVLDFEPMVATNVAEVKWHPTQRVEPLADGRVRLRFTVNGISEIAWWICGYGDQVRIIEPKALRDRVREMHEKAAKHVAIGEAVIDAQVPPVLGSAAESDAVNN